MYTSGMKIGISFIVFRRMAGWYCPMYDKMLAKFTTFDNENKIVDG